MCKFTEDKCFLMVLIYINFLSMPSLPPPNICNWFKRRGLQKQLQIRRVVGVGIGDKITFIHRVVQWHQFDKKQRVAGLTFKSSGSQLARAPPLLSWVSWQFTSHGRAPELWIEFPSPFSELGVLGSIKASSNKWQGKETSNRWHKLRK